MADFIENEGVEYPQLQTQQVEPETVQPQEEEQSEELNEPVNDNVAEPVTEQAEEEELVILPDVAEETEIAEPSLNGLTEVFGNEFKSKEEAKQYLETLKSENEKLKQETETVFANDTVKALNDYMKNGGVEEKEFLDTKYNQSKIATAIEQVKALDPLLIVKEDLKVNQGLTEDEIELYMSTENEVKLKIEGNRLKKDYLNQLESSLNQSKQQEADMIQSAQTKQLRFTEKIQSYVGELKDVGGVQVNDTDKKTLLKNLSSAGDFIRKHFPLDKDGLPTKEWAINAAKLETHARLVTEVKNKVKSAKAEGVKEAFNQLHNIPATEATAKRATGETVVSEADKILQNLQKNQTARHYN